MILYIDTSEKEKFTLGLYNNKLILKSIKSPIGSMSEKFLPELDKFLENNKSSLENLTGIFVFQGPGSYTSLRIGVSIANTLAWSLDIPIMGILAKNLKCKTQSNSLKFKAVLSKVEKKDKKREFTKSVLPYYSNKI